MVFLLGMAIGPYSPAFAGEGEVSVELSVRKVVQFPDGKEGFAPADVTRPGDVIEYRAVYRNTGNGATRNLNGNLPIPAFAEYIPGTASPSPFTASLDGKTFAAVPLQRKITLADGREEFQEIPPSQYRSLRWALGKLAPGASVVASVRVRVMTESPVQAGGKP